MSPPVTLTLTKSPVFVKRQQATTATAQQRKKQKKNTDRTNLVLFEFANGHFEHLSVCQADAGKRQIVAKNLRTTSAGIDRA